MLSFLACRGRFLFKCAFPQDLAHCSNNLELLRFPEGFFGNGNFNDPDRGAYQNEWTDFIARDKSTCHIVRDSSDRAKKGCANAGFH
jgi:hypothetical protein